LKRDLGLTIAVPRGALMKDTLDRLDALGLDTSEVRSNDRKLLFGDIGVVTMRPSDVPTYVEAGAADVGITGRRAGRPRSSRSRAPSSSRRSPASSRRSSTSPRPGRRCARTTS
jgi:ATP phosphoribosyltransferase